MPAPVEIAISRLFACHRALDAALAAGKDVITLHGIAELLWRTISSTQIRKDLSALGPLGLRGQGYAIKPLVEQLGLVLGLERDRRIAIVRFGCLGHAFAAFVAAREERFKVAAIFDRSLHDCNIGVIAVPAHAPQPLAERLAAAVVRGGELSILTHRRSFGETAEPGYTL